MQYRCFNTFSGNFIPLDVSLLIYQQCRDKKNKPNFLAIYGQI